jgi:hypothetical protein
MPNDRHRKPKVKRETAKKMADPAYIRASISFPPELYRTLEEIAKQKKVSLAWVVRDAAEKYVGAKWPLFADESGKL